MWFSNLRLRYKLIAGFAPLLAVTAASSIFVYVQTSKLAEIERLNTDSDDAVDQIDLMTGDLHAIRAAVGKFVVVDNAQDKAVIAARISTYNAHHNALKTILDKDAPFLANDLSTIHALLDAYIERGPKRQEALASDPQTRQQAVTFTGSAELRTLGDQSDAALTAFHDRVNTWSTSWTDAGNASMAQTQTIVLISGLISLTIGALMCWLIARAVGGPLSAMTTSMRRLAEGSHDIDIPARGQHDELGEMAGAVQVFKDAAIGKIKLEADAERSRHATEEERRQNEATRAEAARQMTQVVDGLAAGLNRLAAGDLMHRLDRPFSSEYETLRSNFNAAVAQLQEAIEIVSVNTGAIRSGTGQISTASDDLSRRTEQQAASLEETAAALSEITTAVKKTAEGAAHARQVVKVTSTDAGRSGDVVARTVQAMSGIERSSQQIGQIIGVIDEIAFQTNLLALNAGVEAARAGDAGRGFAVVASEVRGLAQRSAEAAKEIKTLILASDDQVKAGVQLVGETGKGLTRIVEQIAEISVIVNEIATSAEEQASGLSQVNIAVTQMDQVTQQNAAMVEEATAATHSLASDSEELARAVGRFQIGSSVVPLPGAKRTTAAPPRPASKSAPRRAAAPAVAVASAASRPAPSSDGWEEF